MRVAFGELVMTNQQQIIVAGRASLEVAGLQSFEVELHVTVSCCMCIVLVVSSNALLEMNSQSAWQVFDASGRIMCLLSYFFLVSLPCTQFDMHLLMSLLMMHENNVSILSLSELLCTQHHHS
jgi:hypothetical protein